MVLAAEREPRQRYQTGFFTAGAAPPPSVLHAAARRTQAEQLALSDEDSAAPAPAPQLEVWRADVQPPFRQTDTIELKEGESYQVGRMAASELLLSDPRVSGRHVVFTAVADGMSVCDDSTNGTYLNGKRLEKGVPVVLADGDVVVPLVPLRLPPTEGGEPRADLVVALVYRVGVAAPPCGLPPAATGEASAQGSADALDDAAAEDAAIAAASKASGANQVITLRHPAGALRLASPKPRVHLCGGLEALEERWRAAAEPEEPVPLTGRVEATVVPHHLYTGPRGIMSVLRQWGRGASSPAAPVGRQASPTTGGLAPTSRLASKRPRPAALKSWSPVPARSASAHPNADPFAFKPNELPDDDEPAQARCRGPGSKRRGMRPVRGHVDYHGQLYDLESD
jgi:hypothetical protein